MSKKQEYEQTYVEVHALPLEAIDAIMQTCRHLGAEETPRKGVNITIGTETDGVKERKWARVEIVGSERYFIFRFLKKKWGWVATQAILYKHPKDIYFRLTFVGGQYGYIVTQQEKPPFTDNPFA